jgi:transketolase
MQGNDMDDVIRVLALAKEETGKGKPIAIIMTTLMGKGVDFMENDHGWHGIAPNDAHLSKALAQLPERGYRKDSKVCGSCPVEKVCDSRDKGVIKIERRKELE